MPIRLTAPTALLTICVGATAALVPGCNVIAPIHYAIIVTVNMELALLTPPIGLNLYVLSSISKAPITTVIRGVTPFIVLMLGLLVLVTYVPAISTWLPNLVMGR